MSNRVDQVKTAFGEDGRHNEIVDVGILKDPSEMSPLQQRRYDINRAALRLLLRIEERSIRDVAAEIGCSFYAIYKRATAIADRLEIRWCLKPESAVRAYRVNAIEQWRKRRAASSAQTLPAASTEKGRAP